MSCQVLIPRPVRKQLDALPQSVRRRLLEKIAFLQTEPRPSGCVKLKGLDHEYRIRVGDYRVRYEVLDEQSVVVLLHCKDRKNVYRR